MACKDHNRINAIDLLHMTSNKASGRQIYICINFDKMLNIDCRRTFYCVLLLIYCVCCFLKPYRPLRFAYLLLLGRVWGINFKDYDVNAMGLYVA